MDELRNAAKRKLDSILFGGNAREVMSGGGGWTTETSPDGRITMYVSPDGERMSRQEFESRANKTMARQDAKSFLNAVAEGRGMPGYGVKDENLKVGVILQPRGGRWNPGHDQWSKSVPSSEWKALEREIRAPGYPPEQADQRIAALSARARKPSMEFHSLDAELQNELLSKNIDYDKVRTLQLRKADMMRRYKATEANQPPTDMAPHQDYDYVSEAGEYAAAQSRAKPIPFPDKKK